LARLAVIGDVHDHRRNLDLVLRALTGEDVEAILLVGDLATMPPLEPVARRVLALVAALGLPVFFVPGNHDLPTLGDLSGAVNLDHELATVAGLTLWGLGGAGPNRFGFPYEWSEDEVRARLWQRADILLAHCPPRGCSLDRTVSGDQVGSQALREILAAGKVRLALCGHIHESPGCELVEGVVCANAGALGAPFGAPQYLLVHMEPDELRITHRVLHYIPRPSSLPWCAGVSAGPEPGTRRWRFPVR